PTCLPLSHHTAAPPSESYTLSLHDALPILAAWQAARRAKLRDIVKYHEWPVEASQVGTAEQAGVTATFWRLKVGGAWTLPGVELDRKSTRLNSSHRTISYAVFCLQKKKA